MGGGGNHTEGKLKKYPIPGGASEHPGHPAIYDDIRNLVCVYSHLRIMVCSSFRSICGLLMTLLAIWQGLETCKMWVNMQEITLCTVGIAHVRMFQNHIYKS